MNVVLSPLPLFLVPLFAALGALASLFFSSGPLERRRRPLVLGGLALAMGSLVAAALPLAHGASILSHALRMARVGSFDANLTFWLDRTSFFLTLSALIGALVLLVVGRRSEGGSDVSDPGIGLAAAFLSIALLGDGFPALLTGWIGFALAASFVVGSRSAPSGARVLGALGVGAVAVALGASALFWGLGGRFLDGRRFLGDYRARFEAVSPTKSPSTAAPLPRVGEKAYLTVVTQPGAKVYLGLANEAQLASRTEPFAVAPFVRTELPAGLQKVVIDPGGGALLGGDGREAALIDAVRFNPGDEVTVHTLGSTVTFREIEAQISAAPEAFAARQLGSLRLFDAAVAALGAGLLAVVFGTGRERRRATPSAVGFAAGGGALLVAALGARLVGVFQMRPAMASVVAMAALVTALVSALLAANARRTTGLLGFTGRTLVALTVAATAVGSGAGAVAIACTSVIALTGIGRIFELARAADEPGGAELSTPVEEPLRRPLLVHAAAAAGAPLLVVGSGIGIGSIAIGAFDHGGAEGIVEAVLAGLTGALLAFAALRGVLALTAAPLARLEEAPRPELATRSKKKQRASASRLEAAPAIEVRTVAGEGARPSLVFAILACVIGPASAFAAGFSDDHASMSWTGRGLALVAIAAASGVGIALARIRYRVPSAAMQRDREGFFRRFTEADPDPASEADGRSPRPTGTLGIIVNHAVRALESPLDFLRRPATKAGGDA